MADDKARVSAQLLRKQRVSSDRAYEILPSLQQALEEWAGEPQNLLMAPELGTTDHHLDGPCQRRVWAKVRVNFEFLFVLVIALVCDIG